MTDGGIDGVIFDWGGTLASYVSIEEIDVWGEAARRVVAHDGLALDVDDDVDPIEHLRVHLYAAEDRFWSRVTADCRSGRVHEIVLDALGAAGVGHGQDLDVHHVAAGHLDAWDPHISHFDDAVETLTALRERGMRIGLLSNTHWPGEFHEQLLARDGLLELIDARVYSSDLPWLKPHPEAFRAAADAIGVDPRRAVFVGDRLYDDISGAAAVGMRTVHRPNAAVDSHDIEPDGVAVRLVELLDLVDRWTG